MAEKNSKINHQYQTTVNVDGLKKCLRHFNNSTGPPRPPSPMVKIHQLAYCKTSSNQQPEMCMHATKKKSFVFIRIFHYHHRKSEVSLGCRKTKCPILPHT